MLTHGRFGGNFAGTQSSVKLYQAVGFRFGGILGDGAFNHRLVCKQIEQSSVRAETERTEQYGGAYLALSVNVNPQNTLRVLLEFQPRAAVGYNGRAENFLTRLVPLRRVIRAGGTDEL